MSFSESLNLDVSAALRSIDQLEAQLTAAAKQFRVEAFKAIDDLRTTPIRLEIDTQGIATEVTRAIDSADTTVDVDTSQIRPEIEAAVPNEVEVPVDADTTRARAELRRLDTDLDASAGRANLLRTALATIGTAAVIQGIRGIADAGGALQEQVSGSTVVFGEFAAQIQNFAATAPSIGLASDEALRAANNFGLMAQSAGLAGVAAAEFATVIVSRAADIASLRDLNLGETIQALQSGLAGETEPLRRLGSFLNEARVAAEAFRLGLVASGEELSEQAKIQARYSLILQDTAIAQGDFARTADSLTNSQRILRAEFRNLIAQIGIDLAPAFSEVVGAAGDLLPVFEQLVRSVLPPLLEVAVGLAPAFGQFAQILVTLAPVLEVLADVIGAIPSPLIAAVGAFVAFKAAAGPSVGILRDLGIEIPRTTAAFGAITAGLAAASVVFAAYAETQQKAAKFEAEREETIATLNRSLDEGVSVTQALTAAIEGASAANETFRSGLAELGVNTAEFAEAATAAGSFAEALGASSGARRESVDLSFDEVLAIANEAAALREGVTARLDYLASLSDSNRALVDNALATNTAADGSADEAAALAAVNRELERQARLNARVLATYEPLVTSIIGTRDALDVLDRSAPEVSSALLDIRFAAGNTETAFFRLATGIDAAGLSGDDLAITAGVLGVDVETLSGFVDDLTGSLDEFVSSATTNLPTVASVFSSALGTAQEAASESADRIRQAAADQVSALRQAATDSGTEFAQAQADAITDGAEIQAQAVEEAARVTAQGLTDALNIAALDLGDFRNDLAAITAAGFPELAATLAQQGSEAGGALADELADALLTGNVEILEGLQAAQDNFETQSMETVDFIKNELAPQFLSATGLLSSAITEAFGSNLDFEERVRIAGELASSELDTQGQAIAAVAAVEGEEAARAYATALDLEGASVDAAIAAGVAIGDNAPVDEAADAGLSVGLGFVRGLDSSLPEIEAAVDRLMTGGVTKRIQGIMEVRSPSKVTERLGAFVAEGFALGIAGGVDMVARSSEALAQAAMVNTSQMSLVGAPGGPSPAFDDGRMISALERLASKVGNQETWNIHGFIDPFGAGQEIQRQQRARRRGR